MAEGIEQVNLLSDPILSADPIGPLTLPGVLAASVRDEVRSFPRLRAHQRAAWHMFRVQLAALALDRAGRSEIPLDDAAWRDLLLGLTGGDAAPWALFREDRAAPAFLQPADPGGLKWEPVPTPDALDLLITSRNHDLKAAVAADATPEDWVLALVSLQTSEGYGGRGNFGVARMNGGSSSRVLLGLAPAETGGQPDPSSWWRRDLSVLLRSRNAPTKLTRGGVALLWTLPWPEGGQIPAKDMDPWAIEVCRRIRLSMEEGKVRAERSLSTVSRVAANEYNGVLDDPWAPISDADAKPTAMTLSENGRFDYCRMVALLTQKGWHLPPAARLETATDEVAGDMVVIAEALARGNSKTGGLRSRTVPLPKVALGLFRKGSARISTAAAAQLEEIGNAEGALREAVALYAAGGDREKLKAHRKRVLPKAKDACDRLDALVDRVFFDHLWERAAAMEKGPDAEAAATRAFRRALADAARAELTRAFGTLPCPAINAPRARTRAQSMLEGRLRRHNLVEDHVDA